MRVLTVNAGSSSLKIRLLGHDDEVLFSKDLTAHRGIFDRNSFDTEVSPVEGDVDVVGHRVVHGGTRFTCATLIDSHVEKALSELADLAPLHQPRSLAGIDAASALLPDVPQVACFDTAFHATLPEVASTYAIPSEWREGLGVRRYGFHGLSHAYASRRAAELLGRELEEMRIVTCHLGSGASLAAVMQGASVDTTMGFTPLEGLVMATRSGTIDPGIVTWLIEHAHMSVEDLAQDLEHSSGLLAVAGTADMRQVESRAASGDSDSRLALGLYVHRLRSEIASMASSMNGIDTLVFTGGVGENSAVVRSEAAAGLSFLGMYLDDRANRSATPDVDISAPGAELRTLVVEAREDVQIADEVRRLLGDVSGSARSKSRPG
jgi:acetate kinase